MKSISKGSLYLVILSLLAFSISHSREAKEYDNDINYDEQKIPHYDLPKLLVTPDGKKITSINDWEKRYENHKYYLFTATSSTAESLSQKNP